MKRIKPVVLKDATKLTNSEMKSIRGGATWDVYPTSCTVFCNLQTGAVEPFITEHNCPSVAVDQTEYYCIVESGVRAYCQSRYTGNTVDLGSATCQYINDGVEELKIN